SLMTPLKILSITGYQISQSDLDFFPCCQSLFQLKHLDLRGVVLQDFDLMPLRGLLEKVADTLKTLDLLGCRIEDSQVNVLLPALRQCSRLRYVNFYNNDFSMAILKDLFQHTVNWSKMKVEKYPAPLECYDDLTHLFKERFPHLCQDLVDTLRAVRQPKNISFATLICHTCDERCVYDQVSRLCGCWE
ncbi:oogenesin-2-like, partial [Grammomys surdaster]|uniref:oogenesin-2-like n=1 Tax=Grammomys surdaster TaxID=491861 RepID=UPI0010A0ABB8